MKVVPKTFRPSLPFHFLCQAASLQTVSLQPFGQVSGGFDRLLYLQLRLPQAKDLEWVGPMQGRDTRLDSRGHEAAICV
jgi:hypothetical protein